MSFTCHICGSSLDSIQEAGYIPIGESEDEKHTRWVDAAGRHMAALHTQVVSQIVEASAGIGYLILMSNVRTDDKGIEARTRRTLEHTVTTVSRLDQELKPDPERFLRTF